MENRLNSMDYVELAGLRFALLNLEHPPKPNTQAIMDWMRSRIKELESRRG